MKVYPHGCALPNAALYRKLRIMGIRDPFYKRKAKAAAADTAYNEACAKKMADLKEQYRKEISEAITLEQHTRNVNLAKEIYLSVGRYDMVSRNKMIRKLLKCCREAMRQGLDMDSDEVRNDVFSAVTFRVKLEDEAENRLFGRCVLDLANIKYSKDLTQIRGKKIATVFQDPMTSLNPIITIGQQITSIILKHQHCSEAEARIRAMELMKKVGIPNAENRFDDYPFQYSGGMRQRAGIARTLAMNPKVILMDEPFSAVDHLTKCTLQEELINIRQAENKTVLFVTHDINEAVFLADRVVLLSPRPSTIQKIYEIPLEQKRGRSDPLLLKIAAEIAKDINSGGQDIPNNYWGNL